MDYGADLRAYIDALATGGASLQLGPSASPLAGFEQVLGFDQGSFFGDQVRIEEEFTQDNESWSRY